MPECPVLRVNEDTGVHFGGGRGGREPGGAREESGIPGDGRSWSGSSKEDRERRGRSWMAWGGWPRLLGEAMGGRGKPKLHMGNLIAPNLAAW